MGSKALYEAARNLVLNPMNLEARAEVEFLVNWKTCRHCQESKHIDEFDLESTVADGRRSICKECRSAAQASKRAARKENAE